MKNADIKAKLSLYGIEWVEVATSLKIPLKDLVRRLNTKEASPQFRRDLLKVIDRIRQRPEDFYDDFS